VIFAFLAIFAVNILKAFLPQSSQRAAKARKEILQLAMPSGGVCLQVVLEGWLGFVSLR